MFPIEKLHKEAADLPENPQAVTRVVAKVAAFMAAFGFSLLSLYSVLIYSTDESLPLMTKFSGLSLLFFLVQKNIL